MKVDILQIAQVDWKTGPRPMSTLNEREILVHVHIGRSHQADVPAQVQGGRLDHEPHGVRPHSTAPVSHGKLIEHAPAVAEESLSPEGSAQIF